MAGARTAAGTMVEDVTVGGLPALLDQPARDVGAVILYLHGGGYRIGSPACYRGFGSHLAVAAGATVIVVDYRLAPEHPFPAAVDDAVAAYRWLLDAGTPPSQLAIAGDSAGGGLTVATLLAIRDAGLPQPAAAVCISPWADLTSPPTSTSAARRPIRTSAARRRGVGRPTTSTAPIPTNPLASPRARRPRQPGAGARARVRLRSARRRRDVARRRASRPRAGRSSSSCGRR